MEIGSDNAVRMQVGQARLANSSFASKDGGTATNLKVSTGFGATLEEGMNEPRETTPCWSQHQLKKPAPMVELSHFSRGSNFCTLA